MPGTDILPDPVLARSGHDRGGLASHDAGSRRTIARRDGRGADGNMNAPRGAPGCGKDKTAAPTLTVTRPTAVTKAPPPNPPHHFIAAPHTPEHAA